METLSEINQEERTRRERAYAYEVYQGQVVGLRANVARIEQEQTASASTLATLTQLRDLAMTLPADVLTTRGRAGMAAGVSIGTFVAQSAEDALAALAFRDQDRQTRLAAARTNLAQIEAALAEF